MKQNRLFIFLIVATLLAACSGTSPASPVTPTLPEDTPTQTSTLTRTPTITPTVPGIVLPTFTRKIWPTRTRAPTLPPTATAVPPAGLRTAGPYLAYQRNAGDQYEIVLLDADGQGQQVVPFPADINLLTKLYGATGYLSPDGKWMAYFSGSAGKCMGNGTENTNDLTLKLLNIRTGHTRVVTKLISADYPNNFIEAAQALGDPNITAADLQNAFVCGIQGGLDWSPDGRKLAFAGQLAGVSSDLYVYDLADGSIRQLSSGPEEIQTIHWSNDGQWISTTSAYLYGDGMETNSYRTSADGASVVKVTESTAPLADSGLWLNDHQYIRNKSTMGMGAYDLKVVDLQAETTETIWPGYFSSPAFLPGGNWMAFFGTSLSSRPEDDPPDFVRAIYLVNLTTYQKTRIEMPVVPSQIIQYTILPLKTGQGERFLLKSWDADQEAFILSTDGTVISTGIQTSSFLYQSPDKTEWFAINDHLQVISAQGDVLYSMALPAGMRGGNIFSVVWQPDLSGLFFACSPIVGEDPDLAGIYAVDFLKNRVDKVDPSNVAAIYFNYSVWIGGPK